MNSKPSKSARKREHLALQELGEQLIELAPEQLRKMALGDALLEAILVAKPMRAHGALRRQKQLIGKLMREVDPEPIRAALIALTQNDRADKELFRMAEDWRERLIAGDEGELASYVALVGTENEALLAALKQWSAAPHDKARKLARRRVFQAVHDDLQSLLQKRSALQAEQ